MNPRLYRSASSVSILLLSDERPLVPPKRERVAELPDTPGGAASITRYVPHTYMGVLLSVFKGSPQLVLTAVGKFKKRNG